VYNTRAYTVEVSHCGLTKHEGNDLNGAAAYLGRWLAHRALFEGDSWSFRDLGTMADTENQHCLDHKLAQLLADTSAVEPVYRTILQHLPWERRLLAGRSWKSSAQTTARNKERVVYLER
jgi:hypothetical protein